MIACPICEFVFYFGAELKNTAVEVVCDSCEKAEAANEFENMAFDMANDR